MSATLALLAATALRLPPIDQCRADASFAAFRAGLARAAEHHDSATVLAALDDEVLVDYGGGYGKAAFASTWGLDRPETSKLWSELAAMLSLGCALSGEVRVIPSMMEQVGDDADMYETMLAVSPGAVLRQRPSDGAPVVAALDWHVLTRGDGPTNADFYPVRLGDGREGFVRRSAVRSLLDYRMTIERVGGQWRITNFVAGD